MEEWEVFYEMQRNLCIGNPDFIAPLVVYEMIAYGKISQLL